MAAAALAGILDQNQKALVIKAAAHHKGFAEEMSDP